MKLVYIRGAGDIASGIAVRLYRAGYGIVMSDLEKPTAIRRTVSFSEAIRLGETKVENIRALRAKDPAEAIGIAEKGFIAVIADPAGQIRNEVLFDAEVDAILAKRNTGTSIEDAPVVIGIGPGFTAGMDCHACVETMRGHDLGRVVYEGSCAPNTGIPGNIGGYTCERVLRAPADGIFVPLKEIGDHAEAGETAALVNGIELKCLISGTVRGMLPEGTEVFKGMKSGDIDPRDAADNCYTVSDKALAVAGGVLEALLHFDSIRQGEAYGK